MKLQQVKLAGFKSFVESTAINIEGQLVGIVGPNGCGKSNVIDAVRWVLGESSAKQLRGESMLDVIFNGSLKRKPVSRASVELIFDNSAKMLYGLWNNYDEIAIKRVLTRQGDSSYYINNQQVRRKDITELFLGTGVGTKGYAVIEQGMISRIIESRPEDLRLFVEEAAGVAKYRERRKETLQRLADTDANLQRLDDIHSTTLQQVSQLQEQAQVAKHYQELSQQLQSVQQRILAVKTQEAKQQLAAASQFISHCEDEVQVLSYQIEELNQSLSHEQEHKIADEQALQQLLGQFNEQRTELARVEERFKHHSDLLQRFESEAEALLHYEQEVSQAIHDYEQTAATTADKLEHNQELIHELNEKRALCAAELAEYEASYQQIALQVTNQQRESSQLKHTSDLIKRDLQHKQQQKQQLQLRRARLLEENNAIDLAANSPLATEEFEQLSQELQQVEGEVSEYSRELAQLDQALHEQLQIQQQLERELAANRATQQTLQQLLVQSDADESESWLACHDQRQALWQALRVKPGYELAVTTALTNLVTAQLASSANEVLTVPQHCASVWLAANGASSQPRAGSLSEVVTLSDLRFKQLYTYLNAYQIIDSWQLATQLPAGVIGVTLDGHLATADYIIFNAKGNTHDVLHWQQQVQEYEQRHLQVNEQLTAISECVHNGQKRQQQLQTLLAELKHKQQQLINTRHNLQLELTRQQQIYDQKQRDHERISGEISGLDQEIEDLTQDIEELSIKFEDNNLAQQLLVDDGSALELEILERETARELAKNKLHEVDSQLNKLIVDNQLLQQQTTSSLAMIEEKREQLHQARQKLKQLEEERTTFNDGVATQQIVALQEQISSLALAIQERQQLIERQSTKIIGLKNQIATLNNNYQRNLEKINQTRFKEQEHKILLSTYREQLVSWGLSEDELSQCLSAAPAQSVEQLSQQASDLDGQIKSLGLVNLKAIADLAEVNAKEQELAVQIEDLKQASATLTAAINQIDNESRKLLQSTFDQLNQAVAVYFRTLFGGGNARLALTESDILVAGVQIFAEPPGKKNATIHLLSGGEKALAAMSFVFALFSLNPAPFCLLDEVDAPLDDANTQRFCNLVQELAAKTQFVYISHNRLAMEMADQLVGVTMQEKGVSTIVSVSLVEAVNQLEAVNA